MEEFLGKRYVMVSHENFEDYLSYLGKGYLARKAALSMRPEQTLTLRADDTYCFSFKSALVSSEVTFQPGVEFTETKPDGIKVKSVITIEGNKIIHVQTDEDGKQAKHVREFFEDKLIVTTTADGLDKVVIRRYEIVK